MVLIIALIRNVIKLGKGLQFSMPNFFARLISRVSFRAATITAGIGNALDDSYFVVWEFLLSL